VLIIFVLISVVVPLRALSQFEIPFKATALNGLSLIFAMKIEQKQREGREI
jgi:hypothetical protein